MNWNGISVIVMSNTSLTRKPKENKEEKAINSNENYASYWNSCYLFAVLACCTVFSSSVTLIPRSNSIFYQRNWFEFNLSFGIFTLLDAGNTLLYMSFWFKSKTMQSFWIFLRIYMYYMILWIVPYVIAYAIWCNYFGYNWPIPYLVRFSCRSLP